MIATPEIVQTHAELAAIIHLTIPRAEMMKTFSPAIGELLAELARQGVTPQGAVFAHHLTMSATTFDFELGFRINAPVKANGLTQADGLWEVYSVGPETTPDPTTWRTELNRPLKD